MVTFGFAGIFGIIYVVLTFLVIRLRWVHRIKSGSDDNAELDATIRAHSNFIEYIPFILILSFFCEASGTNRDTLNLLLSVLVLGRMSHAFSLIYYERVKGSIIFRSIGMVITVSVIILLSLTLLMNHVLVNDLITKGA